MDRRTAPRTLNLPFLWLVLAVGMALPCSGQVPRLRLTESMRAAQGVSAQLGLDKVQSQAILEAALPWDACLAHWNDILDSLEAAPMSESELLQALGPVRTALGECRASRSKGIRAALDSSARVAFDALASPERPRVLHFGVHNRLDCNVCKTPQPPTP